MSKQARDSDTLSQNRFNIGTDFSPALRWRETQRLLYSESSLDYRNSRYYLRKESKTMQNPEPLQASRSDIEIHLHNHNLNCNSNRWDQSNVKAAANPHSKRQVISFGQGEHELPCDRNSNGDSGAMCNKIWTSPRSLHNLTLPSDSPRSN
jgi:hypothetical protein